MIDVRLIAILDPTLVGHRNAVQIAESVAQAGATALQLRMKHAGGMEYTRLAAALVERVAIPVYVNDRADVAWAAGAAGVHVGADDLPTARLRGASRPAFGVGVSVGNDREASEACAGAPDYWSVGSVHATAHKPDAGVPIGVTGFRRLAAMAPAGTPVIAIGGVTAERVPELMAAGAAGVAVIGAIFGAPDPADAARRLRAAIDRGR